MDNHTVYCITTNAGEQVTALVPHGIDSSDLGTELVELVGPNFRGRDTTRTNLPVLRPQGQLVSTARKALAKVRGIRRNQRLGRYQGRNSSSTETLVCRHLTVAELATEQLPRQLAGAVWAEHSLAIRVSVGRDNGQRRPELRDRLAKLRVQLQQAEGAAFFGGDGWKAA